MNTIVEIDYVKAFTNRVYLIFKDSRFWFSIFGSIPLLLFIPLFYHRGYVAICAIVFLFVLCIWGVYMLNSSGCVNSLSSWSFKPIILTSDSMIIKRQLIADDIESVDTIRREDVFDITIDKLNHKVQVMGSWDRKITDCDGKVYVESVNFIELPMIYKNLASIWEWAGITYRYGVD